MTLKTEKIVSLFKQPSTYKGIALILSALGILISPEQGEAIGLAIITLIGVWDTFKNKKAVVDATPEQVIVAASAIEDTVPLFTRKP